MFLGFSPDHATAVALVSSLQTGNVCPQFHVVFDELFQTMPSNQNVNFHETWINPWKDSREFCLDGWDEQLEGPLPLLHPDFQTNTEKEQEQEEEEKEPDAVPIHPIADANNQPVGWFDVEENVPPAPPIVPQAPPTVAPAPPANANPLPRPKVSFHPDEGIEDGDHSDGSLGSGNELLELLEDVTMDDDDAEAELEESQLPASPNRQQPDTAIPVSPCQTAAASSTWQG